MATAAADPLFPVPQVAIATVAAGNRSLPAAGRGGPPVGPGQAPPGGDGSDRVLPGLSGPCLSLVGPSQQFLRALNGSVGDAPNRKSKGTQE